MRIAPIVLYVTILIWAGPARAGGPCDDAIATAEQANPDLPAGLLRAIAAVESGRFDPGSGRTEGWPWSVNAAGEGRMFGSRLDAIAFVEGAQLQGVRSIDVGCMQVNLLQHPDAFASLEEAFAPGANVRYAAAFLLDLRRRTGDWATATGHYHSATPLLAEAYASRVRASVFDASELDAGPAAPTPPAGAGGVRVYLPGMAAPDPILLHAPAKLPRVFGP